MITKMTKDQLLEKLKYHVGKTVSIENQNYYHSEDGFTFNFSGTLEYDEEYGTFYVRVSDYDPVCGTVGINFELKNIYTLDKRVYGELRIVLN